MKIHSQQEGDLLEALEYTQNYIRGSAYEKYSGYEWLKVLFSKHK